MTHISSRAAWELARRATDTHSLLDLILLPLGQCTKILPFVLLRRTQVNYIFPGPTRWKWQSEDKNWSLLPPRSLFFFFFCSHSSWDLEQTRPITPPDLMLFSPPHGPLFSFLSYPNLPPKLPPPPFPKYPEFYSFFPVWSCLYNWPFHPFIMFPLVPFFLMQALCPSEILQTFLQKPPDFSWGSPHVRNLRGVKRTGAQQMHVRLSYISEIQTAPHPRLSIRDTPTSCIYYVNYIYVWAFLNIFNEDRMRLRLFSAVLGDQKSRDSWQVCYS